MNKMIVPAIGIFALLLASCKDKNSKTDETKKTDYLVSMYGIDSLKLGMLKGDVEKILNTTLVFQPVNDGGMDTVDVKYKGMDFVLYLEETDSQTVAKIMGMSTTSASCKTASGVGVGSDKIQVIEAYPDNKKYVASEYETYPVRSTTRSVVAVMDTTESRAIQFHIINKKVVSVEINSYYEFY
ncbi:MAG: hypothetical protein ABIR30_07520 [Chitinophagaceae bacterium]